MKVRLKKMDEKTEYEEFANNCYDNNIDLDEAMIKEIESIIDRSKSGYGTTKMAAEKIMRLIFATKYEW